MTMGTPIATLITCSDMFVHRSDTAISASGLFTIFLLLLVFKDKIVENFKMPSAFVLSLAIFILIVMLESIILPVKYVCGATIVTTAVDEVTFKRYYKQLGLEILEDKTNRKIAGFIFPRK